MLSQKYHAIFDYPLVKSDYPRWLYKNESITPLRINATKGQARIKREQISQKKLKIARKASEILSKIPTVLFVGVTGSLAMRNAKEDSDIDLMVITKNGTLWTTRLFVLVILSILQIPFRRANKRDETDKLCFNMWLTKNDLVWNKKDRNIYTAHEIGQVMPLVNKDNTYEKFLLENKWILDFWPHSIEIKNLKLIYPRVRDKNYKLKTKNSNFVEKICYWMQYQYMKRKITRETITPTRAIFHPNNWGKVVMEKLKK